MDCYPSDLVLHIKRLVCSSIRLGYEYVCDYPMVPCAGILLLFLHKLCPSLCMFLLSSSPVFLLTALLLGALLSYGEPCAPPIGEEISKSQQNMFQKSKNSATDCSIEEIENVGAVAYATEKSSENQVVCTEERTFYSTVHDTHQDEKKSTSISTDRVLPVVEGKQQQQTFLVPSNVIVETEEQTKEVGENVELQGSDISNSESYHNEMHSRYQLGELMNSCWQPVMRQDPCSDSEPDSSSDASMIDIILLLDELNHPIDLGAGYPSSTFRDNLDSSSDDEDDSDVCVLEENCEFAQGGEKSTMSCLSHENKSEQHKVEANSISEINLLFRCRMEEVLVHSISESAIGHPLVVKHEDELSEKISVLISVPRLASHVLS